MKRIEGIGPIIRRWLEFLTFRSSQDYWIERYKRGGNSGRGSYGSEALYKANVINQFVETHSIQSIIEFGCGDGHQLSLAKYPNYVGYDISPEAINICKINFKNDPSKSFYLLKEYKDQRAELSLSLDVIYHLVEDVVFEKHMRLLFSSSEKYIIIYSTNFRDNSIKGPHIKHRLFSGWIKDNFPGWELMHPISGSEKSSHKVNAISKADFFIYQKIQKNIDSNEHE